jgi:ferric-dicitrate binding protein FerR (iron transport regulator)
MKEEQFWILMSKKIAGEATAEELEQLQELISGNPGWKTIMENLQELWNSKPVPVDPGKYQKYEDAYLVHINRLKEKVPDFRGNSELAENEPEFDSTPVKKPFYKRLLTYAAAAIFITAVILLNPLAAEKETTKEVASERPVNEITINPGSRTKIQLPDGSQVWVNSGSHLKYDGNFKGSTREVQLDGEAYFDVVKNASRPFIVHTSGIDIKVLGTAFNVKAYNSEPVIEATLIHGSIEVNNIRQPGAAKIMLKPHEKLVFNKYLIADRKDQRAVIKPEVDSFLIVIKPLRKNIADNDITETAWVYNKLKFEDETFADLAIKMERWYNLKITIEVEKLKNYRISGSFVNETVEQALKNLQFLMPFNYSIKNNEVKITKK